MSEPFAAIERALAVYGTYEAEPELVQQARAELQKAEGLLAALRFAQEVIARYTHGREVPAGMILSVSTQMEAAIAACQPKEGA